MEARKAPERDDSRVIIHFDYDCFYASVFEARTPSLRSLPFAVQQKQIIVTCNYEARRRGLHKLQLIRDAKRICPDVIIELGEDISQFRDASKELYSFIKRFSWNNKIERLGFDEVWLDVTDIVEYNLDILNRHDLRMAFFQVSRHDPTEGFAFDATAIAGHTWPKDYKHEDSGDAEDNLTLRLRLGSHLALHIRHQLEEQKGYTCTVGVSTNKLLSKLVGNCNKPKGQTTLMPPLTQNDDAASNAIRFVDRHEIGKIPGIGFKLAQKLREFFLQRPADFDAGLVYGGTKENVTVGDFRAHPDVSSEMLEELLTGPGSPRGIGFKIWCLLHVVDAAEVNAAKVVPSQISIEDSYIKLDTMSEVLRELTHLSKSLLNRMRVDLLAPDEDAGAGDIDGDSSMIDETEASSVAGMKWLAHPKTLRLTTRPRPPLQPDGTRVRTFKRISHSAPLPNFVFGLNERIDALAEKLVKEALVSMFRRLHPEKAGWNLSLVNLAVTNMAETAGNSKTANGRDIGNMFRKQEDVLKDFRVTDTEQPIMGPVDGVSDDRGQSTDPGKPLAHGVEEVENVMFEADEDGAWDDGEADECDERCEDCGLRMPPFALIAHRRFHSQAGG